MCRYENYSLLLLAGGKSRRMGQDKALLLYQGKSFLENSIEKAAVLGIQKIYLSGNREKTKDVTVVEDIYPGLGPMAGLHAGMKSIETPYFFVLPVDVPQIPVQLLENMLESHENVLKNKSTLEKPYVLRHEGMLEPLIGIYPTSMAQYLEEKIQKEQLSVFRMLKELECDCFEADVMPWQIANINTQEDYEQLLKRV